MATKKMPHQFDAEQRVLGILFIDAKKVQTVLDQLKQDDFYDETHKIIFDAIKHVYMEKGDFDFVSVGGYLHEHHTLDKIGGMEYMYRLSDLMPSVSNLGPYIELIREAKLKRDIISFAEEIMQTGYSGEKDVNHFVDYAEQGIFEISKRRRTSGFIEVSTVADEVRSVTERNSRKTGETTGLSTGYTNLDDLSAGLQPQELIILAARPSIGKSAFAMNLAINVAQRNKNSQAHVAIFSLEMSNEQLVSRMISSIGNIRNSKIKTGNLTPKEWQFFESTIQNLKQLNIHFDDSGSVTVQDIRAKCRKLAQENKLDFVVIDYLQLIRSEGRTGNRQEEVANISRSLKQMARELNVPILALSQLSREVDKREDKKPVLADLRESGSIEQDADIVMFLSRPDFYKGNEETSNDVEVIIAKNRQGLAGVSRFFKFDTEYSRFTAQENREEAYKPNE
jgi:replicative DNA helicase